MEVFTVRCESSGSARPDAPEEPPCIGCGAPLPPDAEYASACDDDCYEEGWKRHGRWRLGLNDEVKPLFVPMHSLPYYRFVRGNKTVEIRNAKRQWNPEQVRPGRPALVRRGYSTPDQFRGVVGRVKFADDFSCLPLWALRGADLMPGDEQEGFFDPREPVVAFEILQKEEEVVHGS